MPVATASTFGSKMMSSGAPRPASTSRSYARPQIVDLAVGGVGLALLVEAITTMPAP